MRPARNGVRSLDGQDRPSVAVGKPATDNVIGAGPAELGQDAVERPGKACPGATRSGNEQCGDDESSSEGSAVFSHLHTVRVIDQ